MSDLLYIVLAVLGLLATGFGLGGYMRGRKKALPTIIVEKPPADVVAPPVIKTAPTAEDVDDLDNRAEITSKSVVETSTRETAVVETSPSTTKPDPEVVHMLRDRS